MRARTFDRKWCKIKEKKRFRCFLRLMTDNTPATKSDLQTAIQTAVKELKEYIDERTHDAETRLLRAFHDYKNSAGIRFRKMEADVSNIDASTSQRLGELERQMTEIKIRLIALEGKPPA